MTSNLSTPTNDAPTSRRNWVAWAARYRELSIFFFILALAIVVGIRAPVFLSPGNFRDILMTISILLIVALGQTMVIITGGIDLSVSSTIGLTAMMCAATVVVFPTIPMPLVLLLGMVLGGNPGHGEWTGDCLWQCAADHHNTGDAQHLPRAGLLL